MVAVTAFFPPRSTRPIDAPTVPISLNPSWPRERRAMAHAYNRLGGLMSRLAAQFQVEVPAALAVWYVESSAREHTPGRAIIRFENHVLFDQWGKFHPQAYDQHFQHGGRPPQVPPICHGPSWHCHFYRMDTAAPFVECHEQGQSGEYDVLGVAIDVAGEDPALRSISMGGPQIMGFNYAVLGYPSPREMYDAFQGSEGAQVRGFFAYCEHHGTPGAAISALRNHDWITFARLYNGSGQEVLYGGKIQSAYAEARRLF